MRVFSSFSESNNALLREMKQGRPLQELKLSAEEKARLKSMVRQSRASQSHALRAKIILLAGDGWDSVDIANELQTSNQTVC
jgi:hypothetical protein